MKCSGVINNITSGCFCPAALCLLLLSAEYCAGFHLVSDFTAQDEAMIIKQILLVLCGLRETQIKQLYTVETFIAIANTIKDKMRCCSSPLTLWALFLICILLQDFIDTCKTAQFSSFRSFSQRSHILGESHFPDGGRRSEGRILIRCHLEKHWALGPLARRLSPLCKRNKFLFTLMAYRINARGGLYTRSG